MRDVPIQHAGRCLAVAAAASLVFGIAVGPAHAQSAAETPTPQWYPEGYLDLRIAAARQVESFPRDPLYYDLIDCAVGDDLPEGMDEEASSLAMVALDVARMRSEFADLGYPLEVYDQPLLEFEQWAVANIAPAWGARLLELEKLPAPTPEELENVEWTDQLLADLDLRNFGIMGALKVELEARRKRLSPRKPQFHVGGGCGAGEADFEIQLVPANGELWLINAFAFRVCERKVANPWDHKACGWTQYVAGDSALASGRYMYEARWGSTVQRGARVMQGDLEENIGGIITFRRN